MSDMMSTSEVAALYGVTKMTVIRWVEAGRFDPAPERMHTGTGQRKPFLFDRAAVLAQREREVGEGLSRPPAV